MTDNLRNALRPVRPPRTPAIGAIVVLLLFLPACDHLGDEAQGLICDTIYEASAYPASTVSFQTDIVPILANNGCSSQFCHGNTADPPSGFSVLTATDLLGPGNEAEQLGICNVVRGDADGSYVVMKLVEAPGIIGERMPFGGGPIAAGDLQTIRQWITEGAPDN